MARVSLAREGPDGSAPRPLVEVEAELVRIRDGDVSLVHALSHPDLPAIVGALTRRGVRVRLELGDDRFPSSVAQQLVAMGAVGIDVPIEGLERLHDRCHGAGSWRMRLRALRTAQREGLVARACVVLDPAVISDLPELLALLGRFTTSTLLVHGGALSVADRERVIAAAASSDAVDLGTLALHGPPASGPPIPITRSLIDTLMRGARWPAAEAGTTTRGVDDLEAIASRTGGLQRLGLMLAARHAAPEDLPPCLGGRGRADAPSTHLAACLPCPARATCAGVPDGLLDLARPHVRPRRAWRALPPGTKVRVLPGDDPATNEAVIPPLVARLGALDIHVDVGDGPLDGVDLVVTWRYDHALACIDDPTLGKSARVVVGDFRMLIGREAIQARTSERWPDDRLEVVSAFPSFAHLYERAGVPLERVTFRPHPIGPLASERPARWAFATCESDADPALLGAVIDRLGSDGPTFHVLGDRSALAERPALQFVDHETFHQLAASVARARFVFLPLRWDRDRSCGGMPLALARALGRPIVTTRVPMALDHLRDGVDALLVDPGDVDGLTAAIRRIHTDDALRARLSDGAARTARASSAVAWAEELARGAPTRGWPI